MANPASHSFCSSCGSALTAQRSAGAAPSAKSKKKPTALDAVPMWLRLIIVAFVLYSIVVVVLQVNELPSGTVQTAGSTPAPQSMPDASVTDPAVMQRVNDLEKEVSADPKNAVLVLQFANALHDARFFPRAITQYSNYLKLVPTNLDARVDLGICYFETGETDLAVKTVEQVVKENPKHQMAMFNLGIIHLSSQHLEEAKVWFRRCVELDPQSTAGQKAQQILQQH